MVAQPRLTPAEEAQIREQLDQAAVDQLIRRIKVKRQSGPLY